MAVVAISVVVVAVGAGRGGDGGGGGRDDDRSTASATASVDRFVADVGAALRPLVQSTPRLVAATSDWIAGRRSTADVSVEVSSDLDAYLSSRDGLRAVRPLRSAPDALSLMQSSTLLYVETARVYTVLVSVSAIDEQPRAQLDLLAHRLRELADRVYDRGQAMVDVAAATSTGSTTVPDAEVNLPDEVPSWPAEGLAAGPPLDDAAPAGVVGPPPLRAANRPQQRRAAWVADVAALSLPSAHDVGHAIDAGDAGALGELARSLVAAAERLRATPDPASAGGREDSARTRLSLLVAADAARAAQAAALLSPIDAAAGRRLFAIARRLALISDRVWLPTLPPRSSGFSRSLLRDGADA